MVSLPIFASMHVGNSFFRLMKFLKYSVSAGNAHSLHSPFLFDLYTNVISDSASFYSFEKIESLRAKMYFSKIKISVEDLGTGSASGRQRDLSLSYIVEHYVKPKKYGQLLFRLVNHFKSGTILEIGTSLGITTLYLAMPDAKSKVITLEGSVETARIAELNFKMTDAKNIEIITGEFSETLPKAVEQLRRLDFVYFDGNHRKAPTLDYFKQCLAHHHEESVFVFDDIYHSREMSKAWEEIKEHHEVTLSIDLFSIGIIFFRKGLPKQHFMLKY